MLRPKQIGKAAVAAARNVAKLSRVSCIYVLAGTNGAGKSSLMGAMLLQEGVEYFDPDHAAQRILSANPGISQAEANSAAWHQGKRLLERAITEKLDFAFETTLGKDDCRTSSTRRSRKELKSGFGTSVWRVSSATLPVCAPRVAKGGHDIPEDRIRERYIQSRLNLIRLLPRLTELLVYDNSEEADPRTGAAPEPRRILRTWAGGQVRETCELIRVPLWAKPILAAALTLGD